MSDRLEVRGCCTCPFFPPSEGTPKCNHPLAAHRAVPYDYEYRSLDKSPDWCPLGEILIVKVKADALKADDA